MPVRMSGPHLLAGGPRASHVTSLSLSLLICEMGMIRTGNSRVTGGIHTDVTKGAQGLKVLYQMSLALGFNARP